MWKARGAFRYGKREEFYMNSDAGMCDPSQPAITAEEALKIGVQAAHERFPDIEYSRYIVHVEDYSKFIQRVEDIWVVFYSLDNPRIRGGGGPAVHIRKSDGRVMKTYLQR
jgi:hypothetical protein